MVKDQMTFEYSTSDILRTDLGLCIPFRLLPEDTRPVDACSFYTAGHRPSGNQSNQAGGKQRYNSELLTLSRTGAHSEGPGRWACQLFYGGRDH